MRFPSFLYLAFLLTVPALPGQLAAQCFVPDATIWENTWASCTPSANPKAEYGNSHWIQYDLGEVKRLSTTWIWNTNDPAELDRGFKEVKIDYSLDGENWNFWGDFTFARGEGEAIYGGFTGPNLMGIPARFVLITALSNYGDPTCFGIAEIKFNLLPNPEGTSPDGTYENCTPVTSAEVEIVGQNEAFISWEALPNVENYLIEYRLIGTEHWQQGVDDFTELYLEELTPLETYEYRITSLCYSEVSAPYNGTFTLSEEAICPTVEDLEIVLESVSPTEAFLYWELPAFATQNMSVSLIPAGGEPNEQLTFNPEEPAIFLDELSPETTYELTLSWTCADQPFTLDEFSFTTLPAAAEACSAVGEIVLESVDLTTASFSWPAGNSPATYFVAYTIEDDDDWITIETTEPRITLMDLLPEEPYVMVVGFWCGENELYSQPFFFVTEPLVSTAGPSIGQRSVKSFPNPTRNRVAVAYTSNLQEELYFELINPVGQVVQSGHWYHSGGQQQYTFDLAAQIDGVYLLRLKLHDLQVISTNKIVKIGGG
ncbi:MAG: discoidin domain-containing protein [Bacteroidota bacterium]